MFPLTMQPCINLLGFFNFVSILPELFKTYLIVKYYKVLKLLGEEERFLIEMSFVVPTTFSR